MVKNDVIYTIKSVPKLDPCQNCDTCLRVRLMEMGLIPGEKVKFQRHNKDMWIVKILSEDNHEVNKIALRNEEFERLSLEEIDCLIDI
jgi:Fe2+ transport system protein FeoA